MGIQGLSSYITQRKNKFMKNHELHDTYLVIDGNCIMFQTYVTNKCNYCFGGDYDKFAFLIAEFFDSLLKCNITPLIILDGAMEDKKLSTLYSRAKLRISRASMSEPSNPLPLQALLVKDVFKYILRSKNIKIVQACFEADDNIASIARILNCPVLSFDSDFFIYDVMYIPYNTLQQGIFRNSNGRGFVKHCKLFKYDFFVKSFPGLRREVLPLASVLLGNDFISINVFKNFLSTLKVSKKTKEGFSRNKLHLRIETVFRWLQRQSLDSAITKVICKLDSEKRQSIVEVIEMIINGYLKTESFMLSPLGFSPEYIHQAMRKISYKTYKYKKISNFIDCNLEIRDDESYLSWDEELINSSSPEEFIIVKPVTIHNLDKIVPSWFMYEYNAANFPPYFLDMINRQLIVVSEQLEDYNYPTCINISLKIISVIFRLLSKGTTNCDILKYIARGEDLDIKEYELNCKNYNIDCEIPSLQNLVNLTAIERRKIFTSTLGISDSVAVEFPPQWRVYVATIKYWFKEAEEIFTTKYHLTTLILGIVYHVIKKIIYQRTYLETDFRNIRSHDAYREFQGFILESMPIKDALERVTVNECLSAEQFFKPFLNIHMNERFNKTIVHAFSLFQNCLKYSMHFNSLLGCPYPNINVADFFSSGTLIYNLYSYLKNYNNLNEQVKHIFRNSPNILQLIVSISTQINEL